MYVIMRFYFFTKGYPYSFFEILNILKVKSSMTLLNFLYVRSEGFTTC